MELKKQPERRRKRKKKKLRNIEEEKERPSDQRRMIRFGLEFLNNRWEFEKQK